MVKYRGHVIFDWNIHFADISEFVANSLLNVSFNIYNRG